MLVEVCANSLESAVNAEKAGADRIELCSELAVGGITPSYGLLKAVCEKISVPVRVLIRPRSGDFTYSDDEFNSMQKDIKLCAEMGFEGMVIGLLHSNFTIDEKRIEILCEIGHNLKTTFHRAFDWIPDPLCGLEWIQSRGVDTILTSGQQKTAVNGINLLSDLHNKASGTVIMPGSGIHVRNAHLFKEKGFKAIHLSGVQMIQKLQDQPKVPMNSPYMLSDDSVPISDFEVIREVVKAVK